MRNETQTGSNILLTGIILLANLDFTGLLEYGLKALIGGGIWLGYKVAADWLADRKKKKEHKGHKENKENKEQTKL